MAEQATLKRERYRRSSRSLNLADLAQRVIDFYNKDMESRDQDREQRLQRYAKYRMWTEGIGGPWEGSSDVPLSDMQEKSLRVQDTLHNAVMSTRPAINAMAVQPHNQARQPYVDNLLDYQFFEEAQGETIVGDMAEAFLNDGVFTVFVPWVTESRKMSVSLLFDPIPEDKAPSEYFVAIIRGKKGDGVRIEPIGDPEQPWDFRVFDADYSPTDPVKAKMTIWKFYTGREGRVEASVRGERVIFDGPMPRVMDYDDVFHPPRAANLQPPGPSNPGGATHVILRDTPTKDEIVNLYKRGFYDLLDKDAVEKLTGVQRDVTMDDDEETQSDDLAGKNEKAGDTGKATSHETLTRLLCFDRYDIDGDGLDEDVMIWVILETKQVVRLRELQEMYPTLVPNRPRPFAEASLFPVRGRRVGISLLEQIEGLHDTIKAIVDQTMDANTLAVVPFFFYRPTSSMHSERIRLGPGEGFPLAEPMRDVNFPQIGNPNAQAMALNLVQLLTQWEERVTVVGDMQLGRVPAGKSSALRTSQNMQSLIAAGSPRPERIMRRFFNGFRQMFSIMHDLNQFFLPKNKQIRIMGNPKPGQDPYVNYADRDLIAGRYQFTFKANVMNTTAQDFQASLQELFGTFASMLFIQLGIVGPDEIFTMAQDVAKSRGIDAAERGYIKPPSPGLMRPKMFAEEAMAYILENGQIPDVAPHEAGGYAEHLQRFTLYVQQLMDEQVDTGAITAEQGQMIRSYQVTMAQRAAEEARQAQMAANAAALQQGAQGGQQQPGPGRPPQGPPQAPGGNPPISGGGELYDESMPTAGGGANQ